MNRQQTVSTSTNFNVIYLNYDIRNVLNSKTTSQYQVELQNTTVANQSLQRADMNTQRNQSFWPMQFGAVLCTQTQNRPAAVQLQTDQLQQNSVVQGLRDALYSAINEIKSLKNENMSLMEKVNLQQKEWKQEENQLHEELRQKDELLERAAKEREAQTKAYTDILALLSRKESELERTEGAWKVRCGALEERLQQLSHREDERSTNVQELRQQHTAQKQWEEEKTQEQEEELQSDQLQQNAAINEIKSLKNENMSLMEKINLQQKEWRQESNQLHEELRQKDELLKRATKKRQARIKAYTDVLAQLNEKQTELDRTEEAWKARCGALEANLQELQQQHTNQKQWEEEKTTNKEEDKIQKQEEANIHNQEENMTQREEEVENIQKEAAAVQLQSDQLQQNATINEIKSLKKENMSLMEKIYLQQKEWRQESNQLHEELRQKDELLKRATKKRQARIKAYTDVLAQLNEKQTELDRTEEAWKARCGALEAKREEEVKNIKNEQKNQAEEEQKEEKDSQ
ncbi:golgin subfamily A member 6-like protein 25 [Trachinotus anak]|uniref:golgin subfamily A member 6-like protein 25 n=1 Tax=Trachinotus anak TaxID=443729 RepID=UPI0039F1D2B2